MKSVNRNPKKRASCAKRNMKWVDKSEDRKGYCRSKNNKVAKSKSRSHSRKYYGKRERETKSKEK